jgi:hypothetical protein
MSSLITTELEASADTTRVKVTVQVVSFFGEGMLGGVEIGNNAALDNLVACVRVPVEF